MSERSHSERPHEAESVDSNPRRAFEWELGDARVQSISWTDADLVLDLALPNPVGRHLRLCFEQVSRLRVDLDYGEYVGQPLLFAADAEKIEGSLLKVTLEFGAAPDGRIEFVCNSISDIS
jgi:hypothetical protein